MQDPGPQRRSTTTWGVVSVGTRVFQITRSTLATNSVQVFKCLSSLRKEPDALLIGVGDPPA